MIRYPIKPHVLETLIKAEKSDWLDRARKRTEEFRAKGRYAERSSIWSEVKSVYMRLQGDSKCAYCERQLEFVEVGRVEQDVEHFRPKGAIRAWRPSTSLSFIPFTDPPDEGRGYFLLPYNLFNYSAACKPCNSILKRDCFPIAGEYNLEGEDPRELMKERPYLIYPIASFDTDPEDLIRFHGASPQPVPKRGYRRHRALVTIEFFKLDDVTQRKNLIRDRIRIIQLMYPQLEKLKPPADASKSASAKRIIDQAIRPDSPHTNCARSFLALFDKNPAEAKEVFDKSTRLLDSIS